MAAPPLHALATSSARWGLSGLAGGGQPALYGAMSGVVPERPMRSPGPTSRMPGSGGELLRAGLLALGMALVLVTVLRAGDAECPTRSTPERGFYADSGVTSVLQGAGSSKKSSRRWGAQFHITDLGGWDLGLHVGAGPVVFAASSVRTRTGLEPDLLALYRWGRERHHAFTRVTLRERRAPAAPTSSGEVADRPSIASRTLRGPPEFG